MTRRGDSPLSSVTNISCLPGCGVHHSRSSLKRQGRALVSAPVSLTVIGGREDSFEIPGTGVRVAARYLGEPVRRGRRLLSRSDIPRDPAFELRLVGGGASGGPVLLRRGEEADLGPFRVAFPELRFWDHDREIGVRVEPARGGGARIVAGGRSRYFPALVERELEALRGHS